MRVGVEAFLFLSAVLFSLGLYGAVSKKGAVQVLMSLEVMAVAVNINLIAISRFITPLTMDGQFFTVFSMVISAVEVGLGLALVLAIYRQSRKSEVTGLDELKG
ncbi:MAG: NADH-quinone oxidoreductase subunit NuoK [Coriobacteriia bacterium]|nr:NADH-quinone oxidoreductase subunit NuoK [Coriobacteriia bacterium]